MKLADIVKEARGWEGEEAGFKPGIESDDKVSDASVRWMGSFSGRSSVIVRGLAGADRPDQVPSPLIYHLSSASIHLFAFLPVSTPFPPSRVPSPHSPPLPPLPCPRLDTLPVSPVETFVSMSPMPSILPLTMVLPLPLLHQYPISMAMV
jgi:hypothetical protein